jgi:hypothetical protein
MTPKLSALKRIPKKYLLIALAAVIAGTLIAIFTKRQTDIPSIKATPTPSQTILKIINTVPADNGQVVASTINAVTLSFDRPIDSLTAEIEILPKIEIHPLSHSDKPYTLILSPTKPWEKDKKYILTIKNISSLDKNYHLPSPVILNFTAIGITPPVYNESI